VKARASTALSNVFTPPQQLLLFRDLTYSLQFNLLEGRRQLCIEIEGANLAGHLAVPSQKINRKDGTEKLCSSSLSPPAPLSTLKWFISDSQ